MLPWSKNLKNQEPVEISAEFFDPSKRAFPFHDNDGYVEIGEGYVLFKLQRGPIKEHGINGSR